MIGERQEAVRENSGLGRVINNIRKVTIFFGREDEI